MRRLAGLSTIMLVLAGCNWGVWHWPRLGSRADQTYVYFQNDVVGYQGPYVQWARDVWTRSPEIAIVMVDTCPAGTNCVIWRTEQTDPYAGSTGIAGGANGHILRALVRLDPDTGRTGTVNWSLHTVCHEAGHALGGALPPTVHSMCGTAGIYPTAHDYAEAARVYHDDPG